MSSKRAGAGYMWAVIVYLIVTLIMMVMVMVVPIELNLWASSLIAQGAVILPILAAALLTPAPMLEQFPFKKIDFVTVLSALLMTVVLYPTVVFVNAVSMLYVPNRVEMLAEEFYQWPMWSVVLLIGVIGPLSEELCFRGFILQNLRSSGRAAASVILSAVMFAFIHMNFNQASYAFLLGIFLALVVEASGSLWTSVIIHMFFNSFEVVLSYAGDAIREVMGAEGAELLQDIEGQAQIKAALPVYAVMGAGGILLAYLLLKLMKSRRIAREQRFSSGVERGESPKTEVLSFGAVVGLALALVFMVETLFLY